MIKSGDIALSAGAGPFGWLIRKFTRSNVNHVMTLIDFSVLCLHEEIFKRHAARGWFWHSSYIEEPFSLKDPSVVMVRRIRPEVFADDEARQRAMLSMAQRSAQLLGSPYDWMAILDVFNDGVFGNKLGRLIRLNSPSRFMCSEAAAWIARPEGWEGLTIDKGRTNLLTADPIKPFHKTTPADIAMAPWLETVWEAP